MLPERGLIIRQPWIGMILNGTKHWEMRSKPTLVRGRIALIQAGTGLIVGEAYLSGSPTDYTETDIKNAHARHCVDDPELLQRWRYPWILHAIQKYDDPIPYSHPRGAVIWVDLDRVFNP